MKNIPDPKVGDVIEVVVNHSPERKVHTRILKRFAVSPSSPQFNEYTCRIDGEMRIVSWNNMTETYFLPDFTD